LCAALRPKVSISLGENSGLRPCIAALSVDDFQASNSLARLAFENEVSGHRQFRCSTLAREGWCLGPGQCPLYSESLVAGSVRTRRYPSRTPTRHPSPVAHSTSTPTAEGRGTGRGRHHGEDSHLEPLWDSLKELEPLTKRFKRFGGVRCP